MYQFPYYINFPTSRRAPHRCYWDIFPIYGKMMFASRIINEYAALTLHSESSFAPRYENY